MMKHISKVFLLSWFILMLCPFNIFLKPYFYFYILVGSVGFLGGAIIASAVYIVASNDGDNSEPNSEPDSPPKN